MVWLEAAASHPITCHPKKQTNILLTATSCQVAVGLYSASSSPDWTDPLPSAAVPVVLFPSPFNCFDALLYTNSSNPVSRERPKNEHSTWGGLSPVPNAERKVSQSCWRYKFWCRTGYYWLSWPPGHINKYIYLFHIRLFFFPLFFFLIISPPFFSTNVEKIHMPWKKKKICFHKHLKD